jgi:hypothetical protein
MATKRLRTGSGGTKKLGRNKDRCKAYKLARTRDINKQGKLLKHLAKHPEDTVARKALK